MDTFLSPRGLSTAHATAHAQQNRANLQAFRQRANEAAIFRGFCAGGSPE